MKQVKNFTIKWFLRCLLVLSLVFSFSTTLPPVQVQAASSVTPMVAAGAMHTVGLKADGTVLAIGNNEYGQLNVGSWTDIQQVAAGAIHTVGLKADGTVVAVGNNDWGQLNVGSWTDIQQVAAGAMHTVGLKSDGTVVAVGLNLYGQLNVGSWTDTQQIAAGVDHTVGLKADGTVVAVGNNSEGQLNVGSWTDIQQVAAGYTHTVGLKADGTVVAVGYNNYGQLNVGGWTDIQQITVGFAAWYTVGLKADGTVVVVGENGYGQLNVGSWTDIQQVAAGAMHTVGLKADGTVVAVGDNTYGQLTIGSWKGIQQVAAGLGHTVGLKADGTAVATGWNDYGQLNVGSWTGIQQVAAGFGHTVGLKADGTVVAVGNNEFGQCNISGWTDIQQIAAGIHTVGLKADGTVVAVGNNEYGQLNVGSWTGIQQVAAGAMHTVGLKADGTAVEVGTIINEAVGMFELLEFILIPEFVLSTLLFQQNVESWTDLQQVAGGYIHAAGLKADGTVMTAGYDLYGQLNVGSWTDIQQVAAGFGHTIGLKADGTVVAVGDNSYDQCNISGWTDIQQVADGIAHTVGLKADGTVVAVGNNDYGQLNVDVENWFLGTVTSNEPPVADADGPYLGIVGSSITFDGSGSDDLDGAVVSYEWDFGDGEMGIGANPTHAYTATGLYIVTLTVTDDEGATDTAQTTVEISEIEIDIFPETSAQLLVGLPGGVVTPEPDLPPTNGGYCSPSEVYAEYTGPDIQIILQDTLHRPLADPPPDIVIMGADELQVFQSSMLTNVIAMPFSEPVQIELTGPVCTIAQGKAGQTIGGFDAEIVEMSLVGEVPGDGQIMIRESPTQASAGRIVITDIDGGLYHIDSFFDVFTELSVDGGASWIAASEGVRVELVELQFVSLVGPAEVHTFFEGPTEGDAVDDDINGRDEVCTEIKSMALQGMTPTGPIQVSVRTDIPTEGQIEELVNNTPGKLDLDPFYPGDANSFFDVWPEITLDGQVLVTEEPIRLETTILHKPPHDGELYINPFLPNVELIDLITGQGTGIFVWRDIHQFDDSNDLPVADDDAYTTDEDTPLIVAAPGMLGNDIDPDGDTLTLVVLTVPQHGSGSIGSNGSLSYTPEANFNGNDTFSYKASDGTAVSNIATVTITVNPINDSPIANDDSATTDEDNPVTMDVLANDSDVDGDSLSVSSVTIPAHGAGVINPDNTVTYTPAPDYNGTDSFVYTVGDGNGGSDTATITITVNSVNDLPVADDDAYTTDEDTPLIVAAPGMLGNDIDPDGDTLTLVVLTVPQHGSGSIGSNGSLSYTPEGNYNGTDSFTYKANDGHDDSNVATVTITVNPINQPPTADPNGPYLIDVGDDLLLDGSGSSDPNTSAGDSIVSYEWDLDSNGLFDDATGAVPTIPWATIVSLGMDYPADPVTGLPNNTITLRVTDTFGATSTSTTTLTIYEVLPTLTINDVTVSEDAGTATFTVVLSNPSSFPVTVDYSTVDGTATAGSDYDATSGTLTFNPSETTKTISVPIIDDYLYEGDETFYINLSNPTSAAISDDHGIGTIVDNDPLPPNLKVEALSEKVDDNTIISEAMKTSLNASLNTALKVLKDDNPKNDVAAINALEAFINKIEAQRGKKIPTEIADELIAEAQEIIAALSGGT